MSDFQYQTETFADIRILRFRVHGFENLSLNQKKLAYHLAQATLWGRDIFWDQNYKHNLEIRKNLENIYTTFSGDRTTDDFKNFEIFLKRIWFANGLHHHYSTDKMLPKFTAIYFKNLVENSNLQEFTRPKEELLNFFEEIVFNPDKDAKKVFQDDKEDMVVNSAVNFYENITQKQVEEYYDEKVKTGQSRVSYGLNSKLVVENDIAVEKVWKVGGMYDKELSMIVKHLTEALPYAESTHQQKAMQHLIDYYSTGDLSLFDEFNKEWVQDTDTTIDFINGFIETYDDPMSRKATWEGVVQMTDFEADKRVKAISENADWFEAHSPTDKKFKKEKIKGVSAKAINAIIEGGATSPTSPIGINLPNADWIRTEYGSKSVTMSNIMEAYDEVSKNTGGIEEFAFNETEIKLSKQYGMAGSNLHVDMHEIIGHGSGKMAEGVGEIAETLKNHASTIEETRADLVALYFAIDPKLIELGLMEGLEPGYAEYNGYIRGGLMTQLVRVELGKDLEESHMRNRQLIAKWAFDLGSDENVIERKNRNGKSYFVVNDYQKLRNIFARQLKEIQRIKSEGDYQAASNLIEKYAIKIDYEIHREVIERWEKLNIPPYSGFLNPELKPIFVDNEMVDIEIDYPNDFAKQMLEYSTKYSFY